MLGTYNYILLIEFKERESYAEPPLVITKKQNDLFITILLTFSLTYKPSHNSVANTQFILTGESMWCGP